MQSWPSVHIVCLDVGGINYERDLTLNSLEFQGYPGHLTVTTDKVEKDDMGGGLFKVAASWLAEGADCVGFMPYGFLRPAGVLKTQVEFMQQHHLVASYGDVREIKGPNEEVMWEEYSDFSSAMIGVESIPMETLLFDRVKFEEAGGFQNLLAGSHRPNIYITTMLATIGRIERCGNILAERLSSVKPWGYKAAGVLAWDSEQGDAFWRRLKFDKFVRQVKDHYKAMGWSR